MDCRWTLALSSLAFFSCTEARQEEDGVPPMTTASASAEGTAGDAESSTTMVEGDSEDIKLDVGVDTDGNSGIDPDGMDESGCDKVDFLFVIDNSGSMGPFQENLVTNFPGFINTIQETLDEAQDYHIMVVDTDPAPPVDCPTACEQAETDGCLLPDGTCPLLSMNFLCPITCATILECTSSPGGCGAPIEPEPCEIMGAGVVYPRGSDASNTECNFSSGERFMDASEPDLQAAFSCAARVGTAASGASEQPMGAIVEAVTPGRPAFECNGDFIRDDAILVVTFITDEDDDAGDGSTGTVEGWRQALIAAKNGDEQAIVTLGLFGGAGCGEDSLRLTEFVESWEDRGLQGSVCGDYQGFFQQAVDLIDSTCDEFIPPVPAG